MTMLISYAECLDNGDCVNTAQADRQVLSSVWCDDGVIRLVGQQMFPTLNNTGLCVNIADGNAVVNGDSVAYQGLYHITNTAPVTVCSPIGADPANPRIDIVILRIFDDTFDGSGKCRAEFQILTGTPGATPVAPALPANAIKIADVRVNAGQATYATLTDTREYASACGAQNPQLIPFFSSGTFDKSLYPAAKAFRVRAWGAGGGGGGAAATGANNTTAGAGGGGGGYSESLIPAATFPSGIVTITIGAAAAGGTAAGGNGANGGNTTVGSITTANGGAGGQGMTAAAGWRTRNGGNGGGASGGQINMRGEDGQNSFSDSHAAAPNPPGVYSPGDGGGSAGGGASGRGVFNGIGRSGAQFGGGGGGGGRPNSSAGAAGGAGAAGLVTIEIL